MSFIFMQSMSQSLSENSNPKIQAKSPNNAKAKPDGSSFSYARLGVSRIYKVIRGNRMSRNKFMSSIVRKFDTPGWHNSVVSFLIYCTEILSLLPFALPEEPLYLIYAINRVIQVRAGAIESNMKAFLQKFQGHYRKEPTNGVIQHEESGEPVSNENAFVDNNLPVEQQEFPSEISSTCAVPVDLDQQCMNSVNPSVVISQDDLLIIQGDCLSACALQLLLKLKRHLKIIYGLDDARCQAFSPTDPAKPGEFLSRQNIPFIVGETNITQPTTYQDILQRYQEFKNALKEDTVDYSVYTASIKRKRPPVKRSTKAVPARVNGGNNGDDDDDDDDENWGSGTRTASDGRRGGISTRSRQRL